MSSPESTNQSRPSCPHEGVLAPAKEEEIELVDGALASSDDHRVNALGLIHPGLSSASRRELWSPHSPGFSFVPMKGYQKACAGWEIATIKTGGLYGSVRHSANVYR